jgi:hypothetical protein
VTRSLNAILLRSIELVRDAIARTTTRPGLRVVTELARKLYPKGIKAAPEYLENENETVIRDEKLPKYNYIFNPA